MQVLRRWALGVGLLGLGLYGGVWAADVRVVGLFKDKAVISVDGRRHLLSRGERSPEGIGLVEADSRGAVLEIDGRRRRYTLDGRVGAVYETPQRARVQVVRDNAGMFTTVGGINGQTVNFLIDTGASAVAMGELQARRLGLAYRLEGEPTVARTASGPVRAWALRLDRVRLGGIEFRGVRALVVQGGPEDHVLLGMSFLNRLHLHRKGNVLVLEKLH